MNARIRHIEHIEGKVYINEAADNILVLEATVKHTFKVGQWEGLTEGQQEKVCWRLRATPGNIILFTKIKADTHSLSLTIQKKLCGLAVFYLSAGPATGTEDVQKEAGLYLRGFTQPLITKMIWTATKGGVAFTGSLKYGELIYLQGETEGLNGNTLIIEIYFSKNGTEADLLIASYPNIRCRNGTIDMKVIDTYDWFYKMIDGPEEADLLVKIRSSDGDGEYHKDRQGSDLHAKCLHMEKQLKIKIDFPDSNSPVREES